MNERILIVEDEKDVVKLLQMILEEKGYKVFDVSCGEKVTDFLNNHPIDIILLDVILSGMNGYDVCRRLKTKRQTNMIPIIMLTAKAFREDMIRGLSVGADKYITKPFEHDTLCREIENQILKKKYSQKKGVSGEVVFYVQSDLKYLEEFNEMTCVLFEHTSASEKDIENIRHVLSVIGKNAVEWESKNKKNLPIRIRYTVDKEKIIINIYDQGTGFNFKRHLDPYYGNSGEHKERETKGKRPGGLGVMPATVYMDEMRYNKTENEVTIIKHFTENNTLR